MKMTEFRINYVYQIGRKYYKLVDIEELYYPWTNSNTAFTTATTTTFDLTTLKPEEDQLFWIEEIGIDGRVEIQLQFPKGVPRMTPHGEQHFLTRNQAPAESPWKFRFVIKPSYYPSLIVYNPEAVDLKATIWFKGLKLKFRDVSLEEARSSPGIIELTDYAE